MDTQKIMDILKEAGQVSFIDFELFKKIFGVKIASIGLICPECGNIWGFKVFDEKSIADVKQSKLVCFACASKGKPEVKVQE